jgi:hypothetical protein
MATQLVCPYCVATVRPGVLFCEDCGQPLLKPALETAQKPELQDITRFFITTRNLPAQDSALNADTALVLHVRDTHQPLIVRLGSEPLKVGRMDPDGMSVDVDLTVFSAFHKGVSRFHALLQRQNSDTLQVIDRGSANGTFVNGERVEANRPYPVKHGDELAFGQLRMTIQFADAGVMTRN